MSPGGDNKQDPLTCVALPQVISVQPFVTKACKVCNLICCDVRSSKVNVEQVSFLRLCIARRSLDFSFVYANDNGCWSKNALVRGSSKFQCLGSIILGK